MHIILKPSTVFIVQNMIECLITAPTFDEVGKFPGQPIYSQLHKNCKKNQYI